MAGRLEQGLIGVTLAATLPAAVLIVLEAFTTWEILAPGRSWIVRLVIVVGLIAFAALLARVAATRLVIRPLARLRATAARLRDGYLEEEVDTAGMPTDFADVGKALNEMSLKLRIVQEGLEQIVRARTAELRTSEARFRTIVTAIRDYAIFMLDPRGHVLTWNKGAERLKGYTADEVLHQHFELFYTPTERSAGVPQRVLDTAREAGSVELEGWRLRKDGSRFWADVVVTSLYDDDGGLLGYVKVVRDLSDQRAMEADLRRSNRDLQTFAYSASHDLRQPARTVSTYLDLVAQNDLEPEVENYVQRAMAAADRMQGLIDGILAYSRASRARPAAARVAPTRLLEDLRDDLAAMLDEHDATLEIGDLPAVEADPAHLRMALQNLVVNAVQYRHPDRAPVIRIQGKRSDGYVRIEVQDNGIGIAPRHRRQVFEMFKRLHPRDVHDGHGLGLALVKRVIEANGGRVGLRSKEGHGSTFILWLPAARDEGVALDPPGAIDRAIPPAPDAPAVGAPGHPDPGAPAPGSGPA